MVMQVWHRGFILVRAKNALRPVRSGVLYNLAPKGACSRGYKQVAREGWVPGLGFVVDRVLVVALAKSELGVCVWRPDPSYEPWLPFYNLKGRQGFTWVNFPQWKSYSPDPVEACSSCPWGMVTPVEVCRALWKSWGSDRRYCRSSRQ